MSDGSLERAAGPHPPDGIARTVLLAEAAAIGILLTLVGHRVLLPVVASFRGASGETDVIALSRVSLGPAVVVVLVLAAVLRPGAIPRLARILPASWIRLSGETHALRWAEAAFRASIVVFLIAQLNGIAELGALVPIYAMTSGLTLFEILQERVAVLRGHPLLSLCLGSAVGIVPWGVIAFYQVGGGLVGAGPSIAVRILTLAALAGAVAEFVVQWRIQRVRPADGERTLVLLTLVSTSVFAWLAILTVVLPA